MKRLGEIFEMKKDLCLVTYTRLGENFTDELDIIASELHNMYNSKFKVVVCCEKIFEINDRPYEIEFLEMEGTKYRRLINLLERDNSKYYLSIDNDITCNINVIISFVEEMFNGGYEVGWGKIQAKKQKGFISNMICVDKLLSHNIIRPLLWKIGVGISIPGQVFCIKGDTFKGKLIQLDTFLDDVALGLYVNVNKNRKLMSSEILGQERPNSTFNGLWKQRARWAMGYAAILKATWNVKDYKSKVIIHGVSYHFMWLVNFVMMLLLGHWNWIAACAYVVMVSAAITQKNIRMFVYALIYQFVFPIFHIRWGISFLKEIKGV